jgi:predicted nucleic acid-binding protein
MTKLLYIDTNILIYLLERHEPYGAQVADILEAHANDGGELITSTITITEFLAGTMSSNATIIHTIPRLDFVALDEALAEQAAMIQRKTNIKIGDAIHLATAVQQQASFFTNDKPLAKIAKKYLSVQDL